MEVRNSYSLPRLQISTLPVGKRFKMPNLKTLQLTNVLFEEKPGKKHFFAFPNMKYAGFIAEMKESYVENIIGSFKACCPASAEIIVLR